jgi:hypothetical protein
MGTTKSDAVTDTEQPEVVAGPENTLGHYLVVRHPFESYRKGDAIRDETNIKAILEDAGKRRSVHKVIG